jgi:exonuclease VII large subunit
VIRQAAQLSAGDQLELRFSDGVVAVRVEGEPKS